MSAYPLETVIERWKADKLTVEQAIGQILLLIQERDERLQELEGRLRVVRRVPDGDGDESVER